MREPVVQLIRRFAPVSRIGAEWDWLSDSPAGPAQRWSELEGLHRVLILAEAGAGKTFEALERARRLRERGKQSFFLRIEKIDAAFEHAFEIGTEEEFKAWLASAEEAWFFLDSVDEAQLETPRAFEDAIRLFGERIHDARERAHVFITSREDAWQALSDRSLVDQHLPHGAPAQDRSAESVDQQEEEKDGGTGSGGLKIFRLASLGSDEIRLFAGHYGIGDVEAFLAAVERGNLGSMAERPFDLKALIGKWQVDQALGSRLEVLQRLVTLQLGKISAPGFAKAIPLDRALSAARRLAAAATLTGLNLVRMPDGIRSEDRLDPETVLSGWPPNEIAALLKTGIFDDVVYGSVRFRHREIRELLTAEWMEAELNRPEMREKIEALFFRTSYGEQVITPRLRPVLTWLLLFDETIRDRALELEPEVATEGGDASRLPLDVRRRMLADIVARIAAPREVGSILDNTAIERIAHPDLTSEARQLLKDHGGNDDVVFFLGRLVWQGQMTACIPDLVAIAVDATRGIYARIAASRAVMTVGGAIERDQLWSAIAADEGPLDRRLLAELVEGAAPDERSVELLLQSIDRLAPYEQFEVSGLGAALHRFIDRLPMMADTAPAQPLARLVDGFNQILDREPYIERGECHVSQQFVWLTGPALHAVERLVASRSVKALGGGALAILLKVPAVRYWRSDEAPEYRSRLDELVPRWIELNDALYWESVGERRRLLAERGERLTDDWQLSFIGHFWRFSAESFDRCLAWVKARPQQDHKLVALSRSAALYLENDRPPDWLERLRAATAGDAELDAALEARIDPPPSARARKWQAEERAWERKRREEDEREREDRAAFARELRSDPDRVRHPPGLEPGQLSSDQYYLFRTIEGEGLTVTRSRGAHWRALEEEFGEEVAEAFRDAALAHWRTFTPGLRSEGANTSSVPYSLIFAMAGLEIEAGEEANFPTGLSPGEARHAFRYVTWELNGFPRWFEPLYRAHPAIGFEMVRGELFWELQATGADEPVHYILHDIVYYAPWLHAEVARSIYDWLGPNDAPTDDSLRYCLTIMRGGGITPVELAALARAKIGDGVPERQRPTWFALWVDTDAAVAIPALEQTLEKLEVGPASTFAQQFVVALLGDRRGAGPWAGSFRTAAQLKELYVLMHRFIRTADDIERAGKGVYSPTLRDDAQDARNRLFGMLADVPGEATYRAIKALETDHPDPSYHAWMELRARQRAVADADEPYWTPEAAQNFIAASPPA